MMELDVYETNLHYNVFSKIMVKNSLLSAAPKFSASLQRIWRLDPKGFWGLKGFAIKMFRKKETLSSEKRRFS